MKLEQNFTIDGKVVIESGEMNAGLKVFTHTEYSGASIYFVNEIGDIVDIIKIHTDACQGESYVDSVEVSK